MSRHIVVDGLPLSVRSAGVAVYTEQLVRHLAAAAPHWAFTLLRPPFPRGRDIENAAPNVSDRRSWRYPLVMGQLAPLPAILGLESAVGRVDLFHGTTYSVPARCRARTVATVHDLALLRHPELGPGHLVAMVRRATRNLAGVDRIVAVSESTRNDIVELCGVPPERISVVYNGCSSDFYPRPRAECIRAAERHWQLEGPFLLNVGTVEPRKNLPNLIRAFARLRRQRNLPHRLVVVGGKGWGSEPLTDVARSEGVGEVVHFVGAAPYGLLPVLYGAADVFVYPSLYEGFGLPVVEAMASGTPVVASSCAALAEIADGAALLPDPGDPEQIAAAIEKCLDASTADDLRSRGRKRAAHFTWSRSAAATLAVYEQVLAASA
jgi:glycosyltransferase involved in cell wall biosynthesis